MALEFIICMTKYSSSCFKPLNDAAFWLLTLLTVALGRIARFFLSTTGLKKLSAAEARTPSLMFKYDGVNPGGNNKHCKQN